MPRRIQSYPASLGLNFWNLVSSIGSGIIALVGGLSVLFGFQTRLGAWLLVIFLVPVTVMMHNFWSLSDPMTLQIEKAMFLRNVTMLGGALVISYFGAGPLSLDALISQRRGLISACSPRTLR